ncbi:glycosyl transferase [Bacteroides sp. BFG-257]|uniref:glycosyltransferase family 32 protein n=1 Tax=Bacteroides TaxID=816 RepID=UPI001CCFB6E3|nr:MULTISPECIES: glycosyltransferase [Bacteroides]UBD69674.1 glycosyl transferase [Bacteroides cellulosilyticus]UVO98320.1 glycosyl transferase [Bacteroides sp. BFG-257]
MIPKKIHFCWLSGDEYPPLIKYCIDTWHKILPDYEIVLWDTKRFDISSVPWVKDAYEAKKFAFAADYIRVYALYTEGGIYLDSDVEMIKSFNPLLNYKSFLGYEASTHGIEAAIMGAEPGMSWCKKALNFYEERRFSMEYIRENGFLAPNVIKMALQKTYPNEKIESGKKEVNINDGELLICPANYFSPIKYDIEKCYLDGKNNADKYKRDPHTFCIHRFNASWTTRPSRKLQLWDYLKKRLQETLASLSKK